MPDTQDHTLLSLPKELIRLITEKLPVAEQPKINLLCKNHTYEWIFVSKIDHFLKIYFPHHQASVSNELNKALLNKKNLHLTENQFAICQAFSVSLFQQAFAERFQGLEETFAVLHSSFEKELNSIDFKKHNYLNNIRVLAFKQLEKIIPNINEIDYDVLDFSNHYTSLGKSREKQKKLMEIQKDLVHQSRKMLLETVATGYAAFVRTALEKICTKYKLSACQARQIIDNFNFIEPNWKNLNDILSREKLDAQVIKNLLRQINSLHHFVAEFTYYQFQFYSIKEVNSTYSRFDFVKLIEILLHTFDCHTQENNLLISDLFYYGLLKEKLDLFTAVVSRKVSEHFDELSRKGKKLTIKSINSFFSKLLHEHLKKINRIMDLTLLANGAHLNTEEIQQQLTKQLSLLYAKLTLTELDKLIVLFLQKNKLPIPIVLENNPTTADIYTSFKQDKPRIFAAHIRLHTLLDYKDRLGWSPFIWASQLESNAVMHEAYLQYTEYRNQTNGFEVVSIFNEDLEIGLNIQILHWFIACNHFEHDLCKEFLKYNDLLLKDFKKRNVLHFAVANKQLSWLCYLVSRLSEKDLKDLASKPDRDGYTPLERAAKLGNWYAVYVLLNHHATYSPRLIELMKKPSWFLQDAENTTTPLHIAATFFSFDEIQELLNVSALSPLSQDYQGNTPLHLAYRRGDSKIIGLLTNETANAQVNHLGLTPYNYTHEEIIDIPDVIKELQKMNVGTTNHNSAQNFMLIIKNNRPDLMQKIFESGTKVSLEQIVLAHACSFTDIRSIYLHYLSHNLATCFKANPLQQCLQRIEFWYQQRSKEYKKQVVVVPLFAKILGLVKEVKKNRESCSFFASGEKNKLNLSSLKNIHDPYDLAEAFLNVLLPQDVKEPKNKPKK